MNDYVCGTPGCLRLVSGIYCPPCRDARAKVRAKAAELRSEAMAQRWKDDREGMLAALEAARKAKAAPAQEG